MANFFVFFIIILIVGGAVLYLRQAKKNGQKCIGCPHSKECGAKNCHCNTRPDDPESVI